jgi:hypothetical protein
MRIMCLILLLLFLAGVGLLGYWNNREVELMVWDRVIVTTSIPLLVGLTYLAGMFSGWTVVGMLRKSIRRIVREPLPGERAVS